MRALFVIAMFFAFDAAAAVAAERPRGLLWNRSGLASTLPLQVKTDPTADYLLHLRDVETGKTVLAAYIRGGEFFRVLVPPGQYELLFAFGTEWQGQEKLFGRDTQHFVLDPPLNFGATVSRKMGHLVDLRDLGEIAVQDFAFCQRLSLDLDSLRRPKPPEKAPLSQAERLRDWPLDYPVARYDLLSRICD